MGTQHSLLPLAQAQDNRCSEFHGVDEENVQKKRKQNEKLNKSNCWQTNGATKGIATTTATYEKPHTHTHTHPHKHISVSKSAIEVVNIYAANSPSPSPSPLPSPSSSQFVKVARVLIVEECGCHGDNTKHSLSSCRAEAELRPRRWADA